MKTNKFRGYPLIILFSALFPVLVLAGQGQLFKCKVSELHPTQLAVGM
jgi:hypothetical protein